MNSAVSSQILGEFRSLTDVCDVLTSLDIAIGFLSSTGGSPEKPLKDYLQHVLRMPQQNSLRSLKVSIQFNRANSTVLKDRCLPTDLLDPMGNEKLCTLRYVSRYEFYLKKSEIIRKIKA